MKRGDIYWINFDPSVGSEARKVRPAVVISNDASNKYLARLQVIPVTSKVSKIYPSESLVKVNDVVGKAQSDQIQTIDKSRLKGFIGRITKDELANIERSIKIQLGFLRLR